MSRILAVANIKGGVGKTTTVVNLSAALAERDFRVLAIDLDPQSSLTLSMGMRPEQVSVTVRQMLESGNTSLLPIHETSEHWSFIPANVDLRVLEHELETNPHRIPKVAGGLQPLRENYDFILLDCPASAGPLIGAALAAADQVIIPLTPDYLAFQVSKSLFRIIRAIRQNVNPRLRVGGIFLTMYDTRTRHARDFMTTIHNTYEDVPFFSAVVRPSVKVKEAPSLGQSVLRYAPDSQAAKAYRVIADEIINGISTPNQPLVTMTSHDSKTLAPIVIGAALTVEPRAAAESKAIPVQESKTNGKTPETSPKVSNSGPFQQPTAAPLPTPNVPEFLIRNRGPLTAPAVASAVTASPVSAVAGAPVMSLSTGDAVPLITGNVGSVTNWQTGSNPANDAAGNGHNHPNGKNGSNGSNGNHSKVTKFALAVEAVPFELKPPAQEIKPQIIEPVDPHKQLRATALKATEESRGTGLEQDLQYECEQVLVVSAKADVPALLQDASLLLETGFAALAQPMFERVTELDPRQAAGWLGLARVSNDPLTQVKYLQRAYKLNPSRELRSELAIARQHFQEQAYVLLEEGTSQNDAARMAQAHELFKYATTLDPNDERAWMGCVRTSDNLVEKLNYLKRVQELNPQNKDARELFAILGSFVQGTAKERWPFPNNKKTTLILGVVLLGLLGVFVALPWLLPPR